MLGSFLFRVALSLVLFFSFAASGLCTEFVQVRRQLEPGQSAAQVKQELIQEGFVQGAMSEVNSLLDVPLSPRRQELLVSYLEPYVQRLIISYSDLGLKQAGSSTEVVQELELTVNIQALKKILKKIGVFHTCVSPVRYFLSGEGLPTEQIHDLEVLYGLEQTAALEGVNAVLSLQPSAPVGFTARLFIGTRELVSRAGSLERAWKNIWEQYFALPDLALQGTSLSSLWLKGWENSAEVYAFDRTLHSWAKLIDAARLEFSVDRKSVV